MTSHEIYMHRCIELAQLAAGNAAPNPMVGAILVYDSRIIGEGYHQQYGEAHAEVNCFASVKQEDQHLVERSTLYVSLEPCAHFGKTPPCADLIIEKKIPRVVIGCSDPFAQVNGKGIEKLKEAGIEVESGLLDNECRELNKRFFTFHAKHRPYIILKWAQTLDGKIAPSIPRGGSGLAQLPLKADTNNDLEEDFDYETADPMNYALLKQFVKDHRSKPTEAEDALWHQLRGKQLGKNKFRRQHIIGNFIADFVCLPKRLIIEVEGLIHQLPDNQISDEARTIFLQNKGYKVIRFTNDEVLCQMDKVLAKILEELKYPVQNNDSDTSKASAQANPPLGGGGHVRLHISNEFTNRIVHKWRSEEMAIAVGTNTALFDDPQLTTRLWPGKNPVRIVIDMDLRLPKSLKLFNSQIPTIVFNTKQHSLPAEKVSAEQLRNIGVAYYQVTKDVSLVHQMMNALYRMNIQSVLVEGGAYLLQSFIDEGTWDEARVICNKELIIGSGLPAPVLKDQKLVSTEQIFSDVIRTYKNSGKE